MLCEQVLGKLHDFDITGKTIEYGGSRMLKTICRLYERYF